MTISTYGNLIKKITIIFKGATRQLALKKVPNMTNAHIRSYNRNKIDKKKLLKINSKLEVQVVTIQLHTEKCFRFYLSNF